MHYNFDQNLSSAGSSQIHQENVLQSQHLPANSKLFQYMQGTSTSNLPSTESTINDTALNDVNALSVPFSQFSVSRNAQVEDPVEDSVSAFLNGTYTNTHNFYPNSDYVEDSVSDAGTSLYSYQNQTAQKWKDRLKLQPVSSFFVDPNLKTELVLRQISLQPTIQSEECISTLENFHNVQLISKTQKSIFFMELGYRGVKATDGVTYFLRRILSPRPLLPKQLMAAECWKRVCHPNVVQFREIIQTRVFNDNSNMFVYDYYPLAESLKTYYFGRGAKKNGTILPKFLNSQKSGGLSENIIWSYIIQLSSALRHIHALGLTIRLQDISKILISTKSKLLIGSCGIADVLQSNTNYKTNILMQQMDDLRQFGHILLILIVGRLNAATPECFVSSMEYVEKKCSADLKNVIQYLLGPNNNLKIDDIMPMIGARFYAYVETLEMKTTYLEDELSKEMENGRLFRILCKLNTVNERLEVNDAMWSETSDRYFLKLFRDYVFHQINANGKPWIDLSHIVSCLNKLDAGVEENIQLVSRDGDNILIVSYAELRKYLENSFNFLILPQFNASHPS